jgi:hypothetical protein
MSGRILCALMIGCVAPDFSYVIREFGVASFAHTFAGALLVSAPLGFVSYLALILCFRRVVAVLPDPHSGFLMTWDIHRGMAGVSLIAVLIAIFSGALSHNCVDSFTHESGIAVTLLPVLATEAFSIRGEPFHVFRVLQYSGSALGMLMIVGAYYFALRSHCLTERVGMWQDSRRWLLLLGLAGLTVLVAAFLNARLLDGELNIYAIRAFGFRFLITWIPLFGLAFLCLTLLRPRSPIITTNSEQD